MVPCDWWITQPHCLGFCLETDSSKAASSPHFGSWWLWSLLQVSCGISPWPLSQVSRWSVHLDTYLETAAKKIILFRICHCSHSTSDLVNIHADMRLFQTSFSWNWLRAHTAPRCQQERPRSGRLSTMYFKSTSPFFVGGGFRMVGGEFGIHEHQSNWSKESEHGY